MDLTKMVDLFKQHIQSFCSEYNDPEEGEDMAPYNAMVDILEMPDEDCGVFEELELGGNILLREDDLDEDEV